MIFRLTNHGAPAAGVSISSPRSGDRVAARSTDVEGQSSHLGSHEIWIYVQSHAKPQLYPQPGPAQKLAGGMWSARAYFLYGERRDAPVDILAVVATPSADRTIARYFAERETRSGIGRFKALPPGAEIKDRITVTPSAQSTNTECAHAEIRTGSVEGRAEITTLGNRSIVRRAVDPLEGADRGLAPATRLWVFVYSPVVQRFYPQSSGVAEPAVLHDVRFHSAAFFGGQPGEHYDVAAVLATESASRALSRTLLRWARAGDYVGLTAGELPVGLEEKHCVPVVLRP